MPNYNPNNQTSQYNVPITYPNQRTVVVHREMAQRDFLGIKNENWKAAARDLSAHALKLYIYLAANANNYRLALSPTAITEEIGMARSTYSDQFRILVNKGYLVERSGNTFDFYEKPQNRILESSNIPRRDDDSLSDGDAQFPRPQFDNNLCAYTNIPRLGQSFVDDGTAAVHGLPSAVDKCPQELQEININGSINNQRINNTDYSDQKERKDEDSWFDRYSFTDYNDGKFVF